LLAALQDYGHEEVKAKFARDPRTYNIMTKEFISDGNGAVKGVKTIRVEWTQDDTGYVERGPRRPVYRRVDGNGDIVR
jgi:NADPH-dependent glutamate synthase beta subunit-like oxidoreductase